MHQWSDNPSFALESKHITPGKLWCIQERME